MYKKCIICDGGYAAIKLNDLPMRRCVKCGLIWQTDFNIGESHYENQNIAQIDLSNPKIVRKMINMKDRIALFSKYLDLNNLCDIGTGRGLFLKALSDAGYSNAIGIEPNMETTRFYKENHLKVYAKTIEGDIKDVLSGNNIKTVTMFHLIEHIVNPIESLSKIYESMDSGASLILETPNIESYSFAKANYKHKLIYSEHLFYFNDKNILEILKKAGFKIVASGKRDFNQNNFPIKESLFRLGLLKKRNKIKDNNRESYGGLDHARSKGNYSLFSVIIKKIKKVVGKVLSKIVVASGRLDYVWVIAEK